MKISNLRVTTDPKAGAIPTRRLASWPGGITMRHGHPSVREWRTGTQSIGLAGRFSFKTWENGELMVHESVLPYLVREGITFKLQGQATYEHFRPAIRDSDPASV